MRRERWETPDGDFLDLDFGPETTPQAPLALVIHGLEGHARRRYVLSACRALLALGVQPVALNLRGCGDTPNRLPRFYHSGETGDPGFVLQRLRDRHPGRTVGALGFSLGGNILLKLMGERDDGGAKLLDAAAVMSVPFDLAAGADLLERSWAGRGYSRYFLRSLRAKVAAKRDLLESRIDVPAALAAPTIRAFDDAATAPLHGFRDAAQYYAVSSSTGFIDGVRVPTLVLHSLDDPFLPAEAVPQGPLAGNPAIQTVLTARGGHVGFLEGPPWRPRLWGDEAAARFLAARLSAPA